MQTSVRKLRKLFVNPSDKHHKRGLGLIGGRKFSATEIRFGIVVEHTLEQLGPEPGNDITMRGIRVPKTTLETAPRDSWLQESRTDANNLLELLP